MDDYILWTAEDSKVGVGASAPSGIENNAVIRQNNPAMPADLNDRTSEDVWKDIQKQSTTDADQPGEHRQQQQRQSRQQYPAQRQATFGEVTLADFLVHTGIVIDDPDAGSQTAESSSFRPCAPSASAANGFSSARKTYASLSQDWIKYNHQPLQHQQLLQQAEAVAAVKRSFEPPSPMLPTDSPVYDELVDNMALAPDGFANTLALSPSFSDYSLHVRKRFSSEVVAENTMERRQKRMIKNRESAARSRARKQAYTTELETEVTLLKMENARLKQQQALQTRRRDLTGMNSKMQVLRRTQSL